jgi:hypothetical protein
MYLLTPIQLANNPIKHPKINSIKIMREKKLRSPETKFTGWKKELTEFREKYKVTKTKIEPIKLPKSP